MKLSKGIKNFFKKKDGQALGSLGQIGIALATLMVILTVGFLILSQAKAQIGQIEGFSNISNPSNCTLSKACNATSTLQASLDTAVDFVPIVVITAIGAVLLGLVAMFGRR